MPDFSLPRGRGGLREVLKVAFPLVIASLGHAVNLFTDRVMLAAYSPQAMAAAFPAGLTVFTMSCIFLGTVGYAGVFVAQYTGAGSPHEAAKSVWQAVFLALIGGACIAGTGCFATEIFALCGHAKELQPLEADYYRILARGGFIPLVMTALSVFWSGRARTGMIMAVNLAVTACNIPLNYLLIFGRRFQLGDWTLRIPEMGITGAAWGTVGAAVIGMTIYWVAFVSPDHRREFAPLRNWYAPGIFRRLVRFGAPTGIQLVLDLATFNIFVVLLGKISEPVLTASGVAFSVYSLAFNPMIGFGQTASILVGQGVGAKDIPFAEKSVYSAGLLLFSYTLIMVALFLGFPELVDRTFNIQEESVRHLTRIMLIFTSAFMLFDAMNVLYSSAVKGAGDTFFVMITGILLGWLGFALPCALAYWFFSGTGAAMLGAERARSFNVWTLWSILVVYIGLMGSIFYIRFKLGRWKSMRVI
ncbi:MAG: MATE family efflux transporter [Lentisphaeria bacterium]|nr:MATE family efflux transporter [Lentisphaeria bacterium]